MNKKVGRNGCTQCIRGDLPPKGDNGAVYGEGFPPSQPIGLGKRCELQPLRTGSWANLCRQRFLCSDTACVILLPSVANRDLQNSTSMVVSSPLSSFIKPRITIKHKSSHHSSYHFQIIQHTGYNVIRTSRTHICGSHSVQRSLWSHSIKQYCQSSPGERVTRVRCLDAAVSWSLAGSS